MLKKAGIRVGFFLQFGYLGEDKTDIERTIKMVLDLMPDEIGVSVSYPLPGTKFYEKVKPQISKKANWSDSDDLDLMYTGTYQPAYYKKLHRYLHNLYGKKKGMRCVHQILKNPLSARKQHLRSATATPYHLIASNIRKYQLHQLEVNP